MNLLEDELARISPELRDLIVELKLDGENVNVRRRLNNVSLKKKVKYRKVLMAAAIESLKNVF